MIIEAIYIGQNGSIGYKNGVKYALKLCKFNSMAIQLNNSSSCDGFRKYMSIQSFLLDWTDIKTISK